MSATPAFYELGARTNFSFLEGAGPAEIMVVTAQKIGLGGLGIADRNTVAGVVRAHAKAKLEKYKFQPGTRLVFADGTPDILAYPRNRRGWAHLCRMLSAGNLRSQKGTCTLFLSDLLEWQDELQLIVMEGTGRPDAEMLTRLLQKLQDYTGRRLHLGMTPRYDGFDQHDFACLAAIARKTGTRLIATNDVLYHAPEFRPLADIVTAIREHVTIAEAGLRLQANAERHLKNPVEMSRIFRNYPDAIANTGKFFRRLSFNLDELQHNYPTESDGDETPAQRLRRLVEEGAIRRYPDGIPESVRTKIEYELALIHDKQYEPYFLTVHKLVNFARSKDILCQGRGSAANSSVCFCLHVTEVDPNKFTLLFDRFLSRDRDEPPDIDIDFEHARRQEVIEYIYKEYSKEHAGLASAVISYRARSAGREVAKVFGLSEDVQSALSGSIWGWWTTSFSQEQAKAAGLDMSDPTTLQVLKYAGLLMEYPRHLSQHVGGFVITKDRLDEVVPIMNTAKEDRYMIEWDKDDLDTLKILKIDVLALGMLTCLAKAFKLLESHYQKPGTLSQIYETEESKVYDMICRADTLGVFQIESRAQMSMLPRLQPRKFYDLVIEVAIVRPGPIQGDMVHPYLKRRQNPHAVDYPSPELKEVLQRTLGVPLFQEQAMQIAITAAGFLPAEADQLRRAMATFRRTGQVANFEDRMINGMVEKGYEREFAQRCFNQIKGFGEYGFPESHAASFALLVYASCWFKTYYPDVFCTAMLNSQPMGFYPPAQLVRDAREHGVGVLPVDINHSTWDAALEDGGFDRDRIEPRHREMRDVILTKKSVRLGFNLVKGLNENDMIEKLVAHRGQGYDSVRDLWLRSGLTRSAIEKLADADAFRSIGLDRRAALWAVKALDEKSAAERLPLFEQLGHADLQAEPQVDLPVMPMGEQVINDYRSLTLSLKAHPVSFLRDSFSRQGIMPHKNLDTIRSGRMVTIAGLVLVRQRPGTAKGVIFMTLEDETGIANAIVWQKTFEKYRSVVMGSRLVKIRGRLQSESGVIHVVASHMEDMTPALGLLRQEVRSFAASPRADEVLRSTADHRQKQAKTPAKSPETVPRLVADVEDAASVMPKGRNFH